MTMQQMNPPRSRRLSAAISIALGLLSAPAVLANAVVPLSSLDGSNGFRLDGVAFSDWSGISVSAAGDINGDGIDDLVVGARFADPNVETGAGSSYVVFGSTESLDPVRSLSSLDGRNGFRVDGVALGDSSGSSVAGIGDINGDGIDDLIIGAPGADPENVPNAGSSYVVFGRSDGDFGSAINLSALDGSNGFRLDGVAPMEDTGGAVSGIGDINGDGINDLVIGFDPFGAPNSGDVDSSYVVFGRSDGFASAINLSTLDGSNGFRLEGVSPVDEAGRAVSAAGDINGDGIDDLIIGAPLANPNGGYSGSSFVVFGSRDEFGSVIALSALNGSNGFRVDGAEPTDFSGRSVAAVGDINGDGIDDLMIGAPYSQFNGYLSGCSFVVFGSTDGFESVIELSSLDGNNGFRLNGEEAGDRSGRAVSSAGDINGDGIADLVIGAFGTDPNGDPYAGSSYVVYGRSSGEFASSIDLSTLDAGAGFRLDGAEGDRSGAAVAGAGDINGDGIDDLIIGAYGASPNFNGLAGSSYVVFGVAPQDEPLLREAALPAPEPPNASCPSGFFNARIDDGPAPGVQPGIFGLELLLDSPGTRRLAGGLNFGGLIDVSRRGFAGVNIANSAGENQLLNISLTGSARTDLGNRLPVRLNISRRVGSDSTTVLEEVTSLSLDQPYQTTLEVPPGFYVAGVAVEGLPASEAAGAPEGRFFFSLTTGFVGRPGGGFQGGAVVGGYHAENPFGGSSGFASFCLATPHSVSAQVFGAPTYGASGARDLRLQLLDSSQQVLYSVP